MKKFLSQFKDRKHLLRFLLSYPFWLMTAPDKRKPYHEFIKGLLPHVCTFSSKPFDMDKGKYSTAFFYKCTHSGCNICDVKTYLTKDGITLERKLIKWRPERYINIKGMYENANLCDPAHMQFW